MAHHDSSFMINKLSEGQKDCLRLVMQHLSSKEIARELSISPHTVDKRLKQSIATLHANSRFDAARLLAQIEASGTHTIQTEYQPLVYQHPDLFGMSEPAITEMSNGKENQPHGTNAAMLHTSQMAYHASSDFEPRSKLLELVFGANGKANELGTISRVVAILAIAVGSVLIFAILVSVIEGLSRLF